MGMEKESIKTMSIIEDEIITNRHKSRADADFYSLQRQAESNKLLLTPEYLELKRYEAVAGNAKLYFGSNIPSLFMEATSQVPMAAKIVTTDPINGETLTDGSSA